MSRQLLMIIICIGVATIAIAGGKHKGDDHKEQNKPVSHWNAPQGEAQRENPIQRTEESVSRGKTIYMELCSDCHGKNGTGDGPTAQSLSKIPSNLQMMAGPHSDGDLAWKIINGRGDMPGWENELSENEIWDVINFLKNMSAHKATGSAEK